MSSRCPTLGGGGGSGISRRSEGAGGQGRGQRSMGGTVRVWWEYWMRVNGSRTEGRRTVH